MTVSAATASVPTGPRNLTGNAGNGRVSLAWTASTGATAYNVYRGTLSDGEALTPIATTNGSTTSYTDTGASNGNHVFLQLSPRPTASAFLRTRTRSPSHPEPRPPTASGTGLVIFIDESVRTGSTVACFIAGAPLEAFASRDFDVSIEEPASAAGSPKRR